MTWIKTPAPSPENPALLDAIEDGLAAYPGEYAPERRGERRVPDIVKNERIVLSHALIPGALRHMFAGYGALLDPSLPLSRAQHEMIATVVSAINRCFY